MPDRASGVLSTLAPIVSADNGDSPHSEALWLDVLDWPTTQSFAMSRTPSQTLTTAPDCADSSRRNDGSAVKSWKRANLPMDDTPHAMLADPAGDTSTAPTRDGRAVRWQPELADLDELLSLLGHEL